MASPLQPRECIVTKQEGKSFGFFLRIERDIVGHLVRGIEPTSAAAKAGLKDGDRVLRVNGVFVDQTEHPQVVELIKASGNSVNLFVLDAVSYENAKKKGENLENLNQNQPARVPETVATTNQVTTLETIPTTNQVTTSAQKPRICYLVKNKKGYGFSLKTTQGQKGLFLTALAPEGVALKAGVKDNDRLIEVNGDNVENATHDEVAAKVKQSGDTVVFLVIDKDSYKFYNDSKISLKGEMADLKLLPLKPRLVELKKGKDGYGFYLREEHGKKGNFIKDIDSGSPADKSSLKDGDHLVAVNGESVEDLQHEEVVEKIQKGGDKTSLLVVDAETAHLYKMAGVSPSLYARGEKEAPKGGLVVAAAANPAPAPATATARLAPAPASAPAPAPSTAPVANGGVLHKARLCKLVKGPSGYGFHLNAIKNMPGQFIKEVVKGGPADVAGLQDEDIVLEVNGVNVETASYEDVVMRIRDAKGKLTLLVASSEAYEYFKAHNIPVTASLAEPTDDNSDPPPYSDTMLATTEKLVPEPTKRASSSSSSSEESAKNSKDEDEDTQL
ncbi:Na(+)/H(+) exchange regulatory cofactor NHE-RF3 [Pleurodeles waltl]